MAAERAGSHSLSFLALAVWLPAGAGRRDGL